MSDVGPWDREHEAAWRAALATLRSAGWSAELTCFAAPVQVEGRLPTGEFFYFRSRQNEVLLAVGGPDPADHGQWEGAEPHREASYLPGRDGLSVIQRLAARYVAACGRAS